MRAVLTTEVIPWARGAVKEIDIARRLMHHAVSHRTLPKGVDDRLVTVKDPEILEYDEAELRRLHAGGHRPQLPHLRRPHDDHRLQRRDLRPGRRHPGDLLAARRGRGDPRVLPGPGADEGQARDHAGQDLPPGGRARLGLPDAAGRRQVGAREADGAEAGPRSAGRPGGGNERHRAAGGSPGGIAGSGRGRGAVPRPAVPALPRQRPGRVEAAALLLSHGRSRASWCGARDAVTEVLEGGTWRRGRRRCARRGARDAAGRERRRRCRDCRRSRAASPGTSATTTARCWSGFPPTRYDDLALPDVVLGLYDWVIAWDHQRRRGLARLHRVPACGRSGSAGAGAAGDGLASWSARRRSARSAPAGEHPRAARPPSAPPRPPTRCLRPTRAVAIGLRSTFTHRGYLDAVARVREYIVAGDIFQANLSQRFQAPLREPPFELYRRLRRRNPAPFAAYLGFDEVTVLSASPERFLRLDHDAPGGDPPDQGHATARASVPMHDAALGRALAESEKDRAENVMIVDLLRNDLSRVCRPGTVRVPELFALEQHPTVHHLVSTVRGRAGAGGRRGGPGARGVSRRLDHRRAEGPRHGDHRRAGADPAGRLLRLDRLLQRHAARWTPAS